MRKCGCTLLGENIPVMDDFSKVFRYMNNCAGKMTGELAIQADYNHAYAVCMPQSLADISSTVARKKKGLSYVCWQKNDMWFVGACTALEHPACGCSHESGIVHSEDGFKLHIACGGQQGVKDRIGYQSGGYDRNL
jgi:hypothetical protein